MMLDGNPLFPYIVNTNGARQVEFRERKSSHTRIEITERPSKALRECPVQASTLPSAAFWEPLGLLQVLHDEHGLFLS